MKTSLCFFSSLISLSLAGCSMEASIQSVSTSPALPLNMSKTSGLVSGSTQTGTASGGGKTYFVQSTVGSYMSGIDQKTTDGQYRVYSSVQGTLVSSKSH